jgi:hypothetical protein
MAGKKLQDAFGVDPTDLATIIGIATAVLYSTGYIAEKVHWNRLGQADVPVEQVAFLYRGGLEALASLADVLLYFLTLVPASGARMALLVALIAVLASHRLKGRWDGLSRYRALFAAIGALLVIALGWIELSRWPSMGSDILLASTPARARDHSFFRGYAGFTAVLLAHLWASSPSRWKWAGDRKGELIVRRLLVVAAVALLVLLPAVYGSFKYNLRYPIVMVTSSEAQPLLAAPAALLGETEQELFLCRRAAASGSIFRVRREHVKSIDILRIADILDPGSYNPRKESAQ